MRAKAPRNTGRLSEADAGSGEEGLVGLDADLAAGLAADLDAERFFDVVVRFAIRVACRRS
jgi:hypothetical protein